MGRGALIVLICASTAGAQNSPPVPLMQCQQPEYTDEARIAHLTGAVTMSLTIDDDGVPNDIRVVTPLGLGLDESAVSCMGQSRYSPAQKDGKSVPQKMNIELGFQDQWDSDWHLGKVVFHTPDGASRPIFSRLSIRVHRQTGIRRPCAVRLIVDRAGEPADVQITSPHDVRFDKQAVAIAGSFRFKAGMKNGQPVDVPVTLDLVHGATGRVARNGRRQ